MTDPRTDEVTAVSAEYMRSAWIAVDSATGRDLAMLERKFDATVEIGSQSDDDTLWVVGAVRPDRPYAWYLLDRRTGKTTSLFSARPKLDKVRPNAMLSSWKVAPMPVPRLRRQCARQKESSRARQCRAANALLPPRTCQPSQAIPTEAQRGASRGSKAIVERWRRGRELKLSRQLILGDRSSKGGGEVLAEIGRSYNVSLSSI